ncbi:MAG: class I SAM-dependent methyltransferase [Planctomycetaceae bacterium]
MFETIRPCPLCGTDNRTAAVSPYSREHWRIKTCAVCRFVYLENAASYHELINDFAWTKTKVDEKELRFSREPLLLKAERRLRKLRRRTFGYYDKALALLKAYVPRGEFLDVGCGIGGGIERAAPDLRGSGIELDANAAAQARKIAESVGGRVIEADALSGLRQIADDSFDAVMMRAFLEHETQPREVLEESCRVLRPGGYVIIKVPNFGCWNRRVRGGRWCGFRFPDHVNYFVPESLQAMVTAAGYQVARFGLLDKLPVNDNMWMIARRPRTTRPTPSFANGEPERSSLQDAFTQRSSGVRSDDQAAAAVSAGTRLRPDA